MSEITSSLELPESFSINDENWGGKVVLKFSENIVTYDPPISVTTVLLVQSDLIQCGYVGTPPLRKIEGEVLFSEGDTKTIAIDIKKELTKYDLEEIDELVDGEAVLSVDGILWSKSGFKEFKNEQVVKIEKI